jgi:MATE family multidrug resistance protein
MFATVAGVSVNALAAWVLIFGHWGVRPMGIAGAAWAQNIGVFVEMLVAIGFALGPATVRTFNLVDWRPRLAEMRTLLKVGVPSGLQIIADVLAWSAFTSVVMAAFGTKGMAANHFVFRYMSVSFMPAFGISVAVTALVGRYIGRGEPDVAMRRADLGFAVALAYMFVCGLLFLVFRHQLIGLFTRDPEVLEVGAMLLIFAAVYQCFDAMYIVYNGALRGAGDTFVPAVATGVLCWGVTVIGGIFIARRWHDLGPAGPWIAALTYGVILGVFMIARFRRGKWRAIRLDRPDTADRLPNLEMATQN